MASSMNSDFFFSVFLRKAMHRMCIIFLYTNIIQNLKHMMIYFKYIDKFRQQITFLRLKTDDSKTIHYIRKRQSDLTVCERKTICNFLFSL